MPCAFGLYFLASIVGALVAATATATTDVSVPSPLDFLFLLSYALLGLFLWQLGNRSLASGRRDLLDTLIVIGGTAPLCWVFLIEPLLANGSPPAALATYLAYPVSVFYLVGLTARLGFVARRRTMPHLLLGGWIVGELTGDIVFLNAGVNGDYAYGQSWQALWILSATCIGAWALHPQTEVLLERHTRLPTSGPTAAVRAGRLPGDSGRLERDLRDALVENEIHVLYQPLINLPTSDIVGVEALLRWEHPTRGTVSPAQFIPLAETNGAILEIGDVRHAGVPASAGRLGRGGLEPVTAHEHRRLSAPARRSVRAAPGCRRHHGAARIGPGPGLHRLTRPPTAAYGVARGHQPGTAAR